MGESTTREGVILAVSSLLDTVAVRATIPVNPFNPVNVMVVLFDAPGGAESVRVFAEIENSVT